MKTKKDNNQADLFDQPQNTTEMKKEEIENDGHPEALEGDIQEAQHRIKKLREKSEKLKYQEHGSFNNQNS